MKILSQRKRGLLTHQSPSRSTTASLFAYAQRPNILYVFSFFSDPVLAIIGVIVVILIVFGFNRNNNGGTVVYRYNSTVSTRALELCDA